MTPRKLWFDLKFLDFSKTYRKLRDAYAAENHILVPESRESKFEHLKRDRQSLRLSLNVLALQLPVSIWIFHFLQVSVPNIATSTNFDQVVREVVLHRCFPFQYR